jgi:hypothetical protein
MRAKANKKTPTDGKPKKAWWRRKRSLIIIGLLLVVVATVKLVQSLNSPATGTISSSKPATNAASQQLKPIKFDGKYVSFTVPAGYRAVKTDSDTGSLEVAQFYGLNQSYKQLSVSIYKGTLAEDSGVRIRQLNTATYKEEVLNDGVAFVSTKDGYERTVFLVKDSLIASIALTGPGSDLGSESQQIVQSFKWK